MNPPAAAQPPQPQPQPDDAPLKTDIVNNIPMHQAAPTPIKEGEDIDNIIQDVSHQLKKDDVKPPKRHMFSKKPKPEVKPPPVQPPHPVPAAGPIPPPRPLQPKAKHPVPVGLIVVTIIITGILIAAAVAASK